MINFNLKILFIFLIVSKRDLTEQFPSLMIELDYLIGILALVNIRDVYYHATARQNKSYCNTEKQSCCNWMRQKKVCV